MPRMDGTGPTGQGAKTGRGLGPCGSGAANSQGRGLGMGRGAGAGAGFRSRRSAVDVKDTAALEQDEKWLEEQLRIVREAKAKNA